METCPNCLKIKPLCFCDQLTAHDNRIEVVILQHPQEPDKLLGTARLTNLVLKHSVLKTGFSVPNLKSLVGPEANPSDWIVLFLGSKYKFRQAIGNGASSEILFFNKKGEEVQRDLAGIKGVVAIDGTWAQAKALWWRNPWLLKVTRAVINPRKRSLYGNLRREPRHECLSTIESIAYTLEILGEAQPVTDSLLQAFATLIDRYKQNQQVKALE